MSRKAIAARIREKLPEFGEPFLKSMVDQVFDAIAEELAAKDRCTIERFGTFRRQFCDTRTTRNPRTDELTTKQARHVIKFREAKSRTRK